MPAPAVNLFEMVSCVSRALDLLHPTVQHHHSHVAVIASRLARQLGLPEEVRSNVVIAGALHDAATVMDPVGARPADERPHGDELHRHAFDGALLLGRFSPFAEAARIIRHHHVRWDGGRGQEFEGQPVSAQSHLINLADCIASLAVDNGRGSQGDAIVELIRAESGTRFDPQLVEAFLAVSTRASFWLDLVFDTAGAFAEETRSAAPAVLGAPQLLELAGLLGELIDLRSPFTATHSACVGAVAQQLGASLGMTDHECEALHIAGLLHDLGKLAVPPALLDKAGRLTRAEYGLVQTHAYHTHQILKPVACLETITAWAAFHHERLDGRGYPFQPVELSLGSRIVSVADLFIALSEDRPYRPGMTPGEVTRIIQDNVQEGAIDADVVKTLFQNRERFECARRGRNAA